MDASWLGGPLRWLVARRVRASGFCMSFHPECCSSMALDRLVDVAAYAARHALADRAAVLAHYAVHRPHADSGGVVRFDPAAYLAANPDVAARRLDPLRHFVRHGSREGRQSEAAAAPVAEPVLEALLACAGRATAGKVCVVVPVHGARPHVLRCLLSLLRAQVGIAHRVLVVDDASPDPVLARALDTLAAAGRIGLLRLAQNHGFSGAVNAGLATLAPGEDAVLLNSDTEVYDRWLDRLHATARRDPHTGTVTPLTNSGTIVSYPIPLRDNRAPLEHSWAQVDALAARLAMEPVEIPTAVGFCMYVRRECLDATGPLDAAAFPRGYGEENDFCQRAAALGWRHLAATDTFVYHAGSASFGAERAELVRAGLAVLDRRWPAYQAQVRAFIARDPLRKVRLALDCARITALSPARRLVIGRGCGRAPADADVVLLACDPWHGTLTLSCSGAPVTPALTELMLTDMILPYDEPTAATALTLLAPAVLDQQDSDFVGAGDLAKFVKFVRKHTLSGPLPSRIDPVTQPVPNR